MSSLGTGLLLGRLALVTGGGSGIGRATSLALAREGAKVAVADIHFANAEQTVRDLGQINDKYAPFQVDVSQEGDVRKLFDSIVSRFSVAPSIVVNSAGITRDNMLLQMEVSDFDRVIAVNLKGTWLVCQAAARLMIDNNASNCSIINISSIVGKVGNIGQTNYCASKAGVLGLTKSLALELVKQKIRCNVIQPGFTQSPMTGKLPERFKDKMLQMVPMRRMGTAEEVAEVAIFLASDRSSYMTGATVEVTGGLAL
ncbi:PREDICTED: estradiol 17-beta-dehydrogenase 8-like isoform X2 [Priapulus caudatus]|uniref:Estradiol 17-beta-dehydrogenase 8-like isoform X2 n=1 Tax=Priapulus caudatus TaxID=37621 RepID=A0ABM1FBP7_PRICU|nr:PREDICTED: estradiol 17-beta-dehydrogenase 8-like isoform X2 [Priapulus caudatus]